MSGHIYGVPEVVDPATAEWLKATHPHYDHVKKVVEGRLAEWQAAHKEESPVKGETKPKSEGSPSQTQSGSTSATGGNGGNAT